MCSLADTFFSAMNNLHWSLKSKINLIKGGANFFAVYGTN